MSNNQQVIGDRSKTQDLGYSRSEKYLRNEPDLYLILGHKIYPTHLSFMSQCNLISRKATLNQKALILNIGADNETFQQVLDFIYAFKVDFAREKSIGKLIKTAKELEFLTLEANILEDIKKNFDLFNIFILFQISMENKICWLLQRCDNQFMRQNYSQLIDYPAQMPNLKKENFVYLLTKHQELKKKKLISGLKLQQIQKLIQQYNQSNVDKIKVEEFLGNEPFKGMSEEKKEEKEDLQSSSGSLSEEDGPTSPDLKCKRGMLGNATPDKKETDSGRNSKEVSDMFLDIDYVTSPVINLEEMEDRNFGFDRWSHEQECKFMAIGSDDDISEKDSNQQEDLGDLKDQSDTKDSPNVIQLKAIPQINKHFVV